MSRSATKASPLPTSIERLEQNGLRIAWSDGTARRYSAAELREKCPCATCREKRSAAPVGPDPLAVLSPAEAETVQQGGVQVAGMRPVGAYAYHIDFSDGHNTGLFTFRFLNEEVGQVETAAEEKNASDA